MRAARSVSPIDSPTDDELVADLCSGHRDALRGIYDRHGRFVHSLASRQLGSPALADDVTQAVFVHLWRRAGDIDLSRGTLRTYLATVAIRRAIDAARSDTCRRAREYREHGLSSPFSAGRADVAEQVAEHSAAQWRSRQLQDAIGRLPRNQAQAIELAYFRGLSYRQVAAELGVPEGTAKSRLRLALHRLAELLAPTLQETA